ncbi:alpha-L-rhamnosidase [Pseudonocardia spinosispora]|uniref:alpha-L-rhamnosidase n=1 Tax=Pseudonocardia spinosispora TaxID=103441 RepID=UPI0004006968|nr:alpha-L-rhamnosidase [Pseudonocardia spinosispora]
MTTDIPGILRPRALRCEHRAAPSGIGTRRPLLSWKLTGGARGSRQTAYRVEVRSEVEGTTMWDSGWVRSTDQVGIAYQGVPLRSSTAYRWRVTVRDSHGAGEGSAESGFTTGVLAAGEWRASWIGRDVTTLPPPGVPTDRDRSLRCEHLAAPLQLRRVVQPPEPPRRAYVHASARGVYRLTVNGERVGEDELTPGWTDYRHRIQYQTYDVTDLLRGGENVLGAVVADGWWSGYVGFDARHQAMHYGTAPRFLAQLVLRGADGETLLVTDGNWREHPGAIQYSDLLMGEQVDAREDTPGWRLPGYDDSAWPRAVVLDTDTSTLVATGDEPVRATQELPARRITERAEGFVVDFGQNLAGRVRLVVRGARAGQRVQLRHGELLDDDGALYTDNLRSAEATDIYYARGSQVETFEPLFTTHGFRWIEVSGYPGDLDPADVTAIVLHSDTEFVGTFDCDNELVNRLQSNIRWSQRGNFVSVPTDCPQRDERLGWLADAHIFAPTASLNADTAAFYRRWMLDVLSGCTAEGAFPDVAPNMTQWLRQRQGAPAWGDGGVLIPWLLMREYGDRDTLSACFGAMGAWVDYVHRFNPDLVWRHRRGNDYGDWLQIDATTPPELVATAYFARSARTVSLAAAVLGRTEEAARYGALADSIAEAFTAEFADARGRLVGDTQTGYLVALAFGLLPDELVVPAVDRLCTLIEARGHRLTTGFLGVALLAPTLTAHGRADLAHALLVQTEHPSWGYSIANGATTIWERWDGWTEDKGVQAAAMNSYNHYSLGSIGEWLYRGVAGIDQASGSLAWRELVVHPHPGPAVRRAHAEYDSVRGLVRSSWHIEGGRFHLRVTVPPGATATVHIPTSDPTAACEGGHPAAEAEGVTSAKAGTDELVCQVASGSYAFHAPFDGPH